MAEPLDIWYAVKHTSIIYTPNRQLETFGATVVSYFMVSEHLDSVGKIRIRQGKFTAERPQILTPRYLGNEMLENFGAEAREYAEWLLNSRISQPILRYGLIFRKDEIGEETVEGQLEDVAAQTTLTARRRPELCGVVTGVDDLWEVSLFHFAYDLVRRSLPAQIGDLQRHGLLADEDGVPAAIRRQLETEFQAAASDKSRLGSLADLLRRHGLWAEYEDRFYTLL